MSGAQGKFPPLTQEDRDICERIDDYLTQLVGSESFAEIAFDNSDALKTAFLARGVVRGLMTPSPKLMEDIRNIECEISQLADELEYEEEDSDEE